MTVTVTVGDVTSFVWSAQWPLSVSSDGWMDGWEGCVLDGMNGRQRLVGS